MQVSVRKKITFPYNWKLANGYPAKGVNKHNTTVFSTFACGGGSTMGYKLAGYEVVAGNDIDSQMAKVYITNHKPKQFFECSIKDLLGRTDLPKVDILDGSPPCSVFSIAGLREKGWQQSKKFREGQSKQILDDLFFDFINLAEKIKPKIIIAENVKGILMGKAKWYVKEVKSKIEKLGYKCQVFLLNSSNMGLPQQRERVFFIAHNSPNSLKLNFDNKKIYYKDIRQNSGTILKKVTPLYGEYWKRADPGESIGKFNSLKKCHPFKIPNTLVASSGAYPMDYLEPRYLFKEEIEAISSWPSDYNYLNIDPEYLLGMSVPPIMMANIAYEVYRQLIMGNKNGLITANGKP